MEGLQGGGYGASIHAPGSFLFSVKNPWGDAPQAFECSSDGVAMAGNALWGPCFGGDVCISDAGAGCHSFFPSSYSDTLGRGQHTFTVTDPNGQFSIECYEVWAVTARRNPHSPTSSPTRLRSSLSPSPSHSSSLSSPFALTLQAAASPLGALSASLLLSRISDGNRVRQFEAKLGARLKGKRYRLLYTFSKDGRSAASFRHHCYGQVCCRCTQHTAPSHCNAACRAPP